MSVSPPPKIAKGLVAPDAAICVKFKSLPQQCQWGLDDKLQVYFQNERKSGGGDIDNVCLYTDNKEPYAIINFDKPETACSVLARRDHKLIINHQEIELFVESVPGLEDRYVQTHMSTERNDQILPDQSLQSTDGDMYCSSSTSPEWHHGIDHHRQSIQRDRPKYEQRQEHGDHPGSSSTISDVDNSLNSTRDNSDDEDDEPLQLLEVCFNKVSLETVLMYFESKRGSGGVGIKHYDEIQPGKVLITFEQVGVAQYVCSKSHRLEGQTLEVSLIEETGPAPNTIEVSGFPASIGEDTLGMYFENKRRSGGGDIKESNMNEDKTKCTIKFEEAEAVERVLNKLHEIDRSKLTVNRPRKVRYRREGKRLSRIEGDCEKPISKDAVNILARFHQNMSLETVLMYFESKKRSGGGDISSHELIQPGYLVITFEKGVAENVSTRPHIIDGQTLEVSLIEESGPSQNTVEVSGFPTSIGKDTLEIYFESKRRSGGGDIKDCNMNKDKSIFTITFEDETAVDRILARRHELSESCLNVHRPKKVWLYKHQVDKSEVEVHGDTCISTELIQMYFESRSRSGGGGEEVKVRYHKDKKIWTVKFDNPEIADRVLQKSHCLDNKAIKVLRPQPMGMVPDKCMTSDTDEKLEEKEIIPLEVENVKQSISEEYLRLYFENHEKSGGGPIGLIKKNEKVAGNWTIYFQGSGVSQAVAEQKDHELGGSRVTVSLGLKRVRRPLIDRCLLIGDLPKQLNLELFYLYLEKVISQKQPKIKFGRVASKAMVEYRDTIKDIDDVISKIESKKLQNTKINAKKVFEVDTILVKNLDKSVTEEMLKLYFENQDRSGGGNINDMQLDSKKLEVTIQFENYTVVKSVLKKKHRLQNKDLKVCLCYDDIGEIVSDGCQWIPDPVSMPVDPYIFTFANMTPTFNVSLANAGIKIEYNPDDPCNLKLNVVDDFDLSSICDWEDHAACNFKRLFIDQFDKKTLDIGDECFEDFQKYIEDEKKTEDVKLIQDDSSTFLMIVGLKNAVSTVWDRLSHELKKMNDEIERKKKTITERKKYKPIKIKQIHLLGFEEAAMNDYGVKMMVDDQNSMVSFEGLREDVNSAILGLYKELENIAEVSFLLSGKICQFLTDFYDKIISIHADNNLHITYDIDGNRVKIYSTSDKDAMDAKSSFEGMIKYHEYPLPSDKLKVLKSADGKQLLDDLNSPGIVTVELVAQKDAESCIMITGFDRALKQVTITVDEFLSTNQIMEKKKVLDRGVVRLLQKHCLTELTAIESTLNTCFVKLKPSENSSCIVIRGNRSGIDDAIEKIIGLESQVLISKHLISQPGMTSFFKEKKGRGALDSVENHCKCIIEFDGSHRNTSSESMQILLHHTLQSGIELIVCNADMTEMNVDVIVNAANDRLHHIGGLAKAIVDVGGKEIQKESDRIMRARGGRAILPGEVILTNAGNLPCKKIIHTVGPRYREHSNVKQMKRLLMNAVTCVYEEAEKNRFTSIGMPAISSGVYGFPLIPCTEAILEATEEYFEANPQSKVQKVYFLSNDVKVCRGFEAGMETVFNIDQNAKDVVVPDESDSDHDFIDLTKPDDIPTSSNLGLKIHNDIVTTKEGFDIRLIKGKIEDSKVDVIVNTTSGDLNLNSGNVSKALLKAAGSQLQQECDAFKATGKTIPLKGFVPTGPAALNCKKVFHTSSKPYEGQESIQNIRELLQIIFSSASDMNSIVIPALGTGNLHYPADLVAKTMYEEAIEFSKKHPQSSLRDINFMVFHKDVKTIQAFEDEIKDLKLPSRKEVKKLKKQLKPVDLQAENAGDYSGNDEVSSPYKDFKKIDKYQAVMKIGSITVTIKQGDITQEHCDVIVNITSGNFDLNAGAVSKAILNKGGKGIQKECLRNMKSPKDEVWTGPGRLNCGGICHVPNTDSFNTLKPILIRVLKMAEKWKKGTLAFPAIGTGNLSKSSKESAMFILDCICSFAKKQKPTNLRDIRIIVFEKPMTTEFISTMEETEGKPFRHRNIIQKGFDFVKSWIGAGEEVMDDDSPITQTLTLKILAMHEDRIQDAKDRIQSIISDETKEKTIHKEVFRRFSNKHVKKLIDIGAKHEAVVDVTKISSNIVKLHGRTCSVADAQEEIFELINKMQDEERVQKENDLILKEIKWYYASDDNEMEEFDDDIVILLEKAFKNKEKKVKYDTRNNHSYEVDLESMEETDLQSQQTVPVIRKNLTATQSLPATWSPMKPTEKLAVVDLKKGKEYQDVKQQFEASLAGHFTCQSIKISRIQNVELWKQYAAKKEAFEIGMPGQTIERVLYHGTDEPTADKIYNSGFNRSYAGKNATAFGVGTYFAVSAAYSARDLYSRPNAAGEKFMFMSHVLVGKYAQGGQGMLTPPAQPNSTDLYHSVVDKPTNPQIFVIFHDVQAYPSYLISFK